MPTRSFEAELVGGKWDGDVVQVHDDSGFYYCVEPSAPPWFERRVAYAHTGHVRTDGIRLFQVVKEVH